MSNTPQNPKPQTQSNQPKVGDNVRKDEPTAQKKPGGMKDDALPAADHKSGFANKPSKAS